MLNKIVTGAIALSIATSVLGQSKLIVRKAWYESNVDSNSVTLRWTTTQPASTGYAYGRTIGYEAGRIMHSESVNEHVVALSGLLPATTYFISIFSATGSEHDSVQLLVSSASDYRSSGTIDVFFNRSADSTAIPFLPHPNANTNFLSQLKERIDSARSSIDLALYSFSGSTATMVANWLIAAKNRGVKVRFIADSASVQHSNQFTSLLYAGIPAIKNSYGNNGKVASNIHHNKFILFDGRTSTPSTMWLQGGSWNLTDQQTTTDYQNLLYIQDESIVKTYEREFNEEWGSEGNLPDTASRFSTRKFDNTARSFRINGKEVHVFFSPTGGTAQAIDSTLSEAMHSIFFCMFSFTRKDFSSEMVQDHDRGVEVHGIVNDTSRYSQLHPLQQAGLDVLAFREGDTILLHHKYCIIDPGYSDATVITGSYNWSTSAENVNNENLLILRDSILALQYLGEWLKRYEDNGGKAHIILPTHSSVSVPNPKQESPNPKRKDFYLYPNPASNSTSIGWNSADTKSIQFSLYDNIGRLIRVWRSESGDKLNLSGLAPGVYKILADVDRTPVKLVIVR